MSRSERLIEVLGALPRGAKRAVMVGADVILLPLALFSAITLRLGSPAHSLDAGWLYLAVLLVTLPAFTKLGLYRAVVRYVGGKAIAAVVAGVTCSAALLALFNLAAARPAPAGAFVIYWAFALLYVAGSRMLVRAALAGSHRSARPVAIYGACEAGVRLSLALQGGKEFNPVAFIDERRGPRGSVIGGMEVFGPDELPDLVREHGIGCVLLAMPSQSRSRRRELRERLALLGVRVQILPDLADIASGSARIHEIRETDVSDLLGRDEVPPDPALLRACIQDKCVLVTGAGGSIGSELCRQIIRLGPARILLFEVSELALYSIDKELRLIASRERLHPEIVPLLGNAHHKYRVREIMQSYAVQTVYHAAAYKHVPIVEQNMIEGIHNNVFATWHTAEAALETGVETFVLVSTDKAVNPTNVMGATKRFAELVLQGLQRRGGATRFCMVRFGNVLASSGSVVPLFREQIERGGPVTVTHPDVIRYFMTIVEAAQVVIQAGSMAKGGDVFVLDMGAPVRIDDLARRMVQLLGFSVRDAKHPEGDIEIEYTGLRPAEKLYEELLIGDNVTGTEHPRILRAMEHSLPWERVQASLDELLAVMSRFDCRRAREILLETVVEYDPSAPIEDLVSRQSAVPLASTVIPDRHESERAAGRAASPLAAGVAAV